MTFRRSTRFLRSDIYRLIFGQMPCKKRNRSKENETEKDQRTNDNRDPTAVSGYLYRVLACTGIADDRNYHDRCGYR